MNTMMIRGIAGAALMLCMAVVPAFGQGLLRRAQQAVSETITTAVVGDADSGSSQASPETSHASTETEQPSGAEGGSSPRVLAMDGGVLDRFARALDAEVGFRNDWTTFEQEFNGCQARMYANEAALAEFNALTEQMSRQMEVGTTESMIAAGENYQAGMDALVEGLCGISQTDFVRRQGTVGEDALSAALTAGGFTSSQYGMLQERVVPFCAAGGQSARIAGPDGDLFYVYSADEVAALAGRCAALMPAIERVI